LYNKNDKAIAELLAMRKQERVIFVTIGAAGSGKSTFLNNYLTCDSLTISRDRIRFRLLSPDDDYFAKETEVVERMENLINDAIYLMSDKDKKVHIAIDATHLNAASRNKLLNMIHEDVSDYKLCFLYFDTPQETCIENDSRRSGRKKVGEDVIRRHCEGLTLPTGDELKNIKDTYNFKSVKCIVVEEFVYDVFSE
jgi:predicted kinase